MAEDLKIGDGRLTDPRDGFLGDQQHVDARLRSGEQGLGGRQQRPLTLSIRTER